MPALFFFSSAERNAGRQKVAMRFIVCLWQAKCIIDWNAIIFTVELEIYDQLLCKYWNYAAHFGNSFLNFITRCRRAAAAVRLWFMTGVWNRVFPPEPPPFFFCSHTAMHDIRG